jgi:hypothetical protein
LIAGNANRFLIIKLFLVFLVLGLEFHMALATEITPSIQSLARTLKEGHSLEECILTGFLKFNSSNQPCYEPSLTGSISQHLHTIFRKKTLPRLEHPIDLHCPRLRIMNFL